MSLVSTLSSYGDLGLLALRLALGVIFIVHGLPKLKNAAGAAGGMGLPVWFVYVVGIIEALGGLLILLGIFAEISALAIAAVMIGAIYMKVVKWKVPFSKLGIMGWEFDVSLLAGALVIATLGTGSIALERMINM